MASYWCLILWEMVEYQLVGDKKNISLLIDGYFLERIWEFNK